MKQYLITFLNSDCNAFKNAIVEAYNSIVAEQYFNHLFPESNAIGTEVVPLNYVNPEISVYKFPTITEEMIQKVHTDSDIEDLAAELNVPVSTLDLMFSNEAARGTACFGCDNITMRGNSARCYCCSRGKMDNYVEMK